MKKIDLNKISIHGMHNNAWVSEMAKKYPDSLVFRAWNSPESLTEKEMRTAVSITGDAEIALRWERRRNRSSKG